MCQVRPLLCNATCRPPVRVLLLWGDLTPNPTCGCCPEALAATAPRAQHAQGAAAKAGVEQGCIWRQAPGLWWQGGAATTGVWHQLCCRHAAC